VKQYDQKPSGKYELAAVPPRWLMRARGAVKVMLIAVALNETLYFVFTYVAQQIDPDVPLETVSVFSFAMCALMGFWFQSDARRAYFFARGKGYVVPGDGTRRTLHIAADCPKRWLVVLYIELNPALVGL
jgi:hypothetical protein